MKNYMKVSIASVALLSIFTVGSVIAADSNSQKSDTEEVNTKEFDTIVQHAQREYQVASEELSTDPLSTESDIREFKVLSLSIHPAGHGYVVWGQNIDHSQSTTFEISPEGIVTFLEHQKSDTPEKGIVEDTVINAIQEEFKSNQRAIYVMPGSLEGNDGILQWVSHDRISGETRFTVTENDEIIFNESDWLSLPETDEVTERDFKAAARSTVTGFRQYEEFLESEEKE